VNVALVEMEADFGQHVELTEGPDGLHQALVQIPEEDVLGSGVPGIGPVMRVPFRGRRSRSSREGCPLALGG
jgi:hypothetical protein